MVQEQQVGNGDADTEAAVQALEDLALGRKLVGTLSTFLVSLAGDGLGIVGGTRFRLVGRIKTD